MPGYEDRKNLNIGIIGVGQWGKNHARVLHELGCLSAVCDLDLERAKSIAKDFRVPAYDSVKVMNSEKDLDGCLVCTPTKTHSKVALGLIDEGINVFVEKPMSFSTDECNIMGDYAKKNNVLLTAGYIERFNPAVVEAGKLINSGIYGSPIMMEFHRENRLPSRIKDVGIIFDTCVHDIDAAINLYRRLPNVVYARSNKFFHPFEDSATIVLGFGDSIGAIINANWVTPRKTRTFSVFCSNGIISGNFFTQRIKIDDEYSTSIPRLDYVEPLKLELKNFVEAIEGKRPLTVTAEQATHVTRIAEAAILSTQTGKPVNV